MAVAMKLVKPWRRWPSGHVFPAMPENVAGILAARGIAETAAPASRKILHASRDYETKSQRPTAA